MEGFNVVIRPIDIKRLLPFYPHLWQLEAYGFLENPDQSTQLRRVSHFASGRMWLKTAAFDAGLAGV